MLWECTVPGTTGKTLFLQQVSQNEKEGEEPIDWKNLTNTKIISNVNILSKQTKKITYETIGNLNTGYLMILRHY